MNLAVAVHQPEIVELCREFHVQRLELFGSAIKAGFHLERSDFDFLVEFAPLPMEAYASAFFGFRAKLEELLGRPVDLVVASSSRAPDAQQSVEESKTLLYAA